MPGKFLISLSFFVLVFLSFVQTTFAIDDPLAKPNNKIGIHIFFPSEVQNAAKLVNTNGGDWGYVTIPIQAGDQDLKKWQSFMIQCKKFHIIPILRLATNADPNDTTEWRK